jgi:hypothetical protein
LEFRWGAALAGEGPVQASGRFEQKEGGVGNALASV